MKRKFKIKTWMIVVGVLIFVSILWLNSGWFDLNSPSSGATFSVSNGQQLSRSITSKYTSKAFTVNSNNYCVDWARLNLRSYTYNLVSYKNVPVGYLLDSSKYNVNIICDIDPNQKSKGWEFNNNGWNQMKDILGDDLTIKSIMLAQIPHRLP